MARRRRDVGRGEDGADPGCGPGECRPDERGAVERGEASEIGRIGLGRAAGRRHGHGGCLRDRRRLAWTEVGKRGHGARRRRRRIPGGWNDRQADVVGGRPECPELAGEVVAESEEAADRCRGGAGVERRADADRGHRRWVQQERRVGGVQLDDCRIAPRGQPAGTDRRPVDRVAATGVGHARIGVGADVRGDRTGQRMPAVVRRREVLECERMSGDGRHLGPEVLEPEDARHDDGRAGVREDCGVGQRVRRQRVGLVHAEVERQRRDDRRRCDRPVRTRARGSVDEQALGRNVDPIGQNTAIQLVVGAGQDDPAALRIRVAEERRVGRVDPDRAIRGAVRQEEQAIEIRVEERPGSGDRDVALGHRGDRPADRVAVELDRAGRVVDTGRERIAVDLPAIRAARGAHVVVRGAGFDCGTAGRAVIGNVEAQGELNRRRQVRRRDVERGRGAAKVERSDVFDRTVKRLGATADAQVVVRMDQPLERDRATGCLHRGIGRAAVGPDRDRDLHGEPADGRRGIPAVVVDDRDLDGIAARVRVDV